MHKSLRKIKAGWTVKIVAGLLARCGHAVAVTITNSLGISVTLDNGGNYTVQSSAPAWTFGGSLAATPRRHFGCFQHRWHRDAFAGSELIIASGTELLIKDTGRTVNANIIFQNFYGNPVFSPLVKLGANSSADVTLSGSIVNRTILIWPRDLASSAFSRLDRAFDLLPMLVGQPGASKYSTPKVR